MTYYRKRKKKDSNTTLIIVIVVVLSCCYSCYSSISSLLGYYYMNKNKDPYNITETINSNLNNYSNNNTDPMLDSYFREQEKEIINS